MKNLIISLIALLPALATAGTIGISNGQLIVGTEAGDGAQAISAAVTATDILIQGTNFDVVTPGCNALSGAVTCALSGFNELIILGGSGDDAITLGAITTKPNFATILIGGAGNDVLVGSAGNDTIFGDAGDDVLIGGPGQDCLVPGTGNDVVIQLAACAVEPDVTPLPREVAAAPEPGELAPLGAGVIALWFAQKRRRSLVQS